MNENKKEHHLHIVLTTQQYQLLCCQAKECRLTKRAYLARLIEGRPVKARPTKEIKELRTEIDIPLLEDKRNLVDNLQRDGTRITIFHTDSHFVFIAIGETVGTVTFCLNRVGTIK